MTRIKNPSLSWHDGNIPFSEDFNDIYYNIADGLAETRTVFLDGNHLSARWQDQAQFTIAETGFGTGLNFLAAWKLFEEAASPHARLDFISVEQFPLHKDDLKRALQPWIGQIEEKFVQRLLHVYPLRISGFHRLWITDRVTMTLIFDEALRAYKQVDAVVDAWFLDGFSPSKNPQLWQQNLFAEIARLSVDGTTIGSFTAAGDVRRGLESVGFKIERKDGHGYKRHRIEGVFQSARKKHVTIAPKHFNIIGAGLAGAAMSHALRRRGIDVTVYDRTGIGAGASGNRLGLINPKIEAQDNPRNEIGLSAYSFARHILSDIPNTDYHASGALHLAHNPEKLERLTKIFKNCGWLDPHIQWVNSKDTKSVCGIDLPHDGIFYPDAASVNNRKLLKTLLPNVTIASPEMDDQTTVLCNGWGLQTYDLPLQSVRGQVTYITPPSSDLKCPVMFGSYVAPTPDGLWALGATFDQNKENTDVQPEDDDRNIESVQKIIDLENQKIVDHWANIRTASRDRFPIAGLLPDQKNTYVLGALGSHGIQFSFLLAEIIACQMTGAPLPVGKDALETISITRFRKKS